jgi:predicted GIY-YIG superfamily endonuclease
MYSVYVLYNRYGKTYIGYTSKRVETRLRTHNVGRGGVFTRGRRPWRAVASITGFPTRKCALRYEYYAKRMRYKVTDTSASNLVQTLNKVISTLDKPEFHHLHLNLSMYKVLSKSFSHVASHPRLSVITEFLEDHTSV